MRFSLTKRLISVLSALVMLLTLMPLSAMADSRTVIDTIIGTFNGVDITPKYGAAMTEPSLTMTTGQPAYFDSNMYGWKKYDGEDFVYNYDDTFSDGIYRYVAQIRVEGSSGLTHVLSKDLTVTIDGQEWTLGTYWSNDTLSYVFVYSPTFTVELPNNLPLTFHDSPDLDIDRTIIGTAITPFSVAEHVAGGTKPYTFSKESGPDWLSVSKDGTISGTPKLTGTNEYLVVKVTDQNGAEQSVRIAVAKTVIDPSERTVIDTIVGTFNGVDITPEYGDSRQQYAITSTVGEPAYFENSMYDWKKYDGTDFKYYYDDTFSDGIYRYVAQIRIDGLSGFTHMLAKDVTVTVDGQEWTLGTYYCNDELSFVFAYSPAMTVWDLSVPRLSFDANGGSGTMKNAVTESGTHTLPKCGFTHPDGKAFLTWSVNGEAYAPGDVITITKNTTAVAVWGEPLEVMTQPTSGSAGVGNGYKFSFAPSLPISKATLEIKDPLRNVWLTDNKVQMTLSGGWLFLPVESMIINNKSVYRVKVTDGVQTAYSDSFTVTWVAGYAVSFAANGGTGTMDAASGILGAYVLPECTFTAPEGMQFQKWQVGRNIYRKPGDIFIITDNTTITAIWEEIPATVTLGDIDQNGVINMRDAMTLYQFVSGAKDDLSEEQQQAGDMDESGGLNMRDVMKLYQQISSGAVA